MQDCHLLEGDPRNGEDRPLRSKGIARQGDTTTLEPYGPVKPENPPANGRSNLRTFYTTFLHNLRRSRAPFAFGDTQASY